MCKNILVIESCNKITEKLKILIEEILLFNFEIEIDKNKILKNYKNKSYKYIIINNELEDINLLIQDIININPKQKFIFLSDSINCYMNCNTCITKSNFIRLLKPLDLKKLLNILNSNKKFTCPNKFKFDSIDTINKLYDFINLESFNFFKKKQLIDEKLIITSELKTNLCIKEINQIENKVSNKYFKLYVNENELIIKKSFTKMDTIS